MAAVPEHGKLKFAAGTTIDEEVSIEKPMTIKGNGVVFTKPVNVVDAEVVLDDVVLTASGESNSDKKVNAVKVNGTQPFTLVNSVVNGTCRTAVSIMTNGPIVIKSNKFDGGNKNIHNMIEFSISSARDITDVDIEGNTFVGDLKNNCISLYNLIDGAKVKVNKNKFDNINVDNNIVRLSNPKNVSADFEIADNEYSFSGEVPNADGYTAFMLLQDYSKDMSQDFSKFHIAFKNLKRNGKKITENGFGLDQVFYVYADQQGILARGVNDPTVTFA